MLTSLRKSSSVPFFSLACFRCRFSLLIFRLNAFLVSVCSKGFAHLLCWLQGRGIRLLVCKWRLSFHEFYNFLLFNFFNFYFFWKLFFKRLYFLRGPMSPVWILKRLVSVFINACRLLSALPSLSQFGRGRLSLVAISFYALSLLFGPCRLSELTLAGPVLTTTFTHTQDPWPLPTTHEPQHQATLHKKLRSMEKQSEVSNYTWHTYTVC